VCLFHVHLTLHNCSSKKFVSMILCCVFLWMFACVTVSADSQAWKSSFQPRVFDTHPSVKAFSADVLVSVVNFLEF